MRRTIAAWAAVGTLAAATAVGAVVLPAGADDEVTPAEPPAVTAPADEPDGELGGDKAHPEHTHGRGLGPGHAHGNGHGPGHAHGAPGGDGDQDSERGGPPGHVRSVGGPVWVTAAEALGLEPGELRRRLRAGETLGEVADERGVDRDELVASLLEVHEQRLRELLDQEISVPGGPPFRLKDGLPGDDG